MSKITVAVFGAGQIGRAVHKIIHKLYVNISTIGIDSNQQGLDGLDSTRNFVLNLDGLSTSEIAKVLTDEEVKYVINALPFHLNSKIALASVAAKCNYIDFTEDDIMADAVQDIFKDSGLFCAVKCGLAPGFINYVGLDLVKQLHTTESLMISVGALPRNVCFSENEPEKSYNLSWSVDGLVNEYIRNCRVRIGGKEEEIPALNGLEKVVLDGIEYEAAFTSGGIGSLVKELTDVPNVYYKTLRYPGHYKYVSKVIVECDSDFDAIKEVFLKKFPFTTDDVIVVYAQALGKDKNGVLTRKSYANRFYGDGVLTAIQSTTAGSGVAMLELMLKNKLTEKIVTHSNVDFEAFTDTVAFTHYYLTN